MGKPKTKYELKQNVLDTAHAHLHKLQNGVAAAQALLANPTRHDCLWRAGDLRGRVLDTAAWLLTGRAARHFPILAAALRDANIEAEEMATALEAAARLLEEPTLTKLGRP